MQNLDLSSAEHAAKPEAIVPTIEQQYTQWRASEARMFIREINKQNEVIFKNKQNKGIE
jgi:hypothetical protein